jgi:hypothetical protein
MGKGIPIPAAEGRKMNQNTSAIVREIMEEFAHMTGLMRVVGAPRRYLWTDAFAVCNYLGLYEITGDERHLQLALRLIDQVHDTLGRHRADDRRVGWISGLSEQEGKQHPTIGGLRIGKKMSERKPSDPVDEHLEWEQDGQYYHYLTKWMHALDRAGKITGNASCLRWAMELAKTAHARFTYLPRSGGRKRMYWKMSIDLSYPLVQSMGHHDPLDGFVTFSQLWASAKEKEGLLLPDLSAETNELAEMCTGKDWATDDPLGLGELLCSALKMGRLIIGGAFGHAGLLPGTLDSALAGLSSFTRRNELGLPADYRLAFRELGLAIGVKATEELRAVIGQNPGCFNEREEILRRIAALMRYTSLAESIVAFWLADAHRKSESWTAHCDINMVMLATSLAPDGYLAS